MRKKLFVLLLCGGVFWSKNVFAASASLSVSKSTIENGSSVTATATLSGAAAWNVKIISSGSTSGCSETFVGDSGTGYNVNKTLSVTCKSTSVGIINFVLSGDITSSDGSNVNVSGSKKVTVTKPREKSTNNELKSLSVEGYEISPSFSKSVREYSVSVPSTVDKINIVATKADSYASISGDGEKEVEEGANLFEIVVTSETGVSNKYSLTVNVEDLNPIEVKVNNQKYTLVKNPKNLVKPDLFEESTVKINDIDIPCFVNTKINTTLVGLKDENGKINLFIYNNGIYTHYINFDNSNIHILFLEMKDIPKNYVKKEFVINDQKVDAYQINNDSRYLIYGQNIETGEKNYYTYDPKEKTLQLFSKNLYDEKVEKEETNRLYFYGLCGLSSLLLLLLILISSKCSKLKKLIKKNMNNNNDNLEKNYVEIDDTEDVFVSDKVEEDKTIEEEIEYEQDDLGINKKKRKKKSKK